MRRTARTVLRALVLTVVGAGMACAPKNPYTPPDVQPPPAYKESDWKPGQPSDAIARGSWWEMFGDATLNDLEARINVSNQTLKQAAARFVEARASVAGARSARYPQVTADPSIVRAQQSGNRAVSSFHNSYGDFLLPATVTYEADVWGRIHYTIESSRTQAQATAADLETVSLSLHAELAVDYFLLRGFDRERELLDSAVAAYGRALELTQNRFNGGLASRADVDLAETQLETTRAQAVDIGVARAGVEHAIAVLVGVPASSFALAPASLGDTPPSVPAGLPSELLERRPDVAAAERRVASANADVGITKSAFYPILSLTGTGGFESTSLTNWITSFSSFWSIGPSALITVFDGGRRRAAADEARAAYDEASATYQQAVLVAFQEVEDQLATLRVLSQEATVQQRAVDAAERSLEQANLRYRGGLASYLEVVVAQSVALQNERAAVDVLTRRMTASVLLIKGLGGGWNVASLPRIAEQH
ncbi:MAG TPA: efflux transporter outer membrane subunit [Vicinamibacterales bacterium]|jgi:NodT family efflux transporter outer membrane factor (OMF) lipoprotein